MQVTLYLLTLPLRMAREALLVPVRDLDAALGITGCTEQLEAFIAAYIDRLDDN